MMSILDATTMKNTVICMQYGIVRRATPSPPSTGVEREPMPTTPSTTQAASASALRRVRTTTGYRSLHRPSRIQSDPLLRRPPEVVPFPEADSVPVEQLDLVASRTITTFAFLPFEPHQWGAWHPTARAVRRSAPCSSCALRRAMVMMTRVRFQRASRDASANTSTRQGRPSQNLIRPKHKTRGIVNDTNISHAESPRAALAHSCLSFTTVTKSSLLRRQTWNTSA